MHKSVAHVYLPLLEFLSNLPKVNTASNEIAGKFLGGKKLEMFASI